MSTVYSIHSRYTEYTRRRHTSIPADRTELTATPQLSTWQRHEHDTAARTTLHGATDMASGHTAHCERNRTELTTTWPRQQSERRGAEGEVDAISSQIRNNIEKAARNKKTITAAHSESDVGAAVLS